MSSVKNLGDGKFSFIVGKQSYTLLTSLDIVQLDRVVRCVQEVIGTLPKNLSQEEILFLALMSFANKLNEIDIKIAQICAKTDAGD